MSPGHAGTVPGVGGAAGAGRISGADGPAGRGIAPVVVAESKEVAARLDARRASRAAAAAGSMPAGGDVSSAMRGVEAGSMSGHAETAWDSQA